MCSISWKFALSLWLDEGNGKHGEWWYHSFDSVKYKHYEGFLLKINFWSKVYSKRLLKGVTRQDNLCHIPHLRKVRCSDRIASSYTYH